MITKVYTAAELREAADNFWVGVVICEVKDEDGRVVKHIKHDEVIAMLRQAAEMMEREEKREKKYEYSFKMASGRLTNGSFSDEETARRFALYGDTVVRREVGEWMEVNDGE